MILGRMKNTMETMIEHKKTVASLLAALSGVCFIAGISLLAYEGSDSENGTYKKIVIND